jgi:hypothetical protein
MGLTVMDSIAPNWAILKSPSNWILVAFSVAVLIAISHIMFKDK